MGPIIIAIDFSASSTNAAKYAADMAVAVNTNIILAHVIEIPATAFHVPMTEFEFEGTERSAKEGLEELRTVILNRTKNKIPVSTEIRYGTVGLAIEKLAAEKKPLAIVAGRKPASSLQNFFIGSNALRLIHCILYPVLVIPEGTAFKPIRHITIASGLTGKKENISILLTKNFLRGFQASLKIIHIHIPLQHAKKNMQPAINTLQDSFADHHPDFYFLENKNVEQGIANFLENNKTDLLIVMPEKHGFWHAITQPGNSNKIVLHANLPILSVAAAGFSNSLLGEEGAHKQTQFAGREGRPQKLTDETHCTT
ncbi:MAG: universal stress protein [Bacteroidetes bacterium]|nr:universal stress protein [Bacteroidota bacterium]MBS1973433.1 universal stress protein [Bacteroidota bacterium]